VRNPLRRRSLSPPVEGDPFVIVDVGARWGIGERWAGLAPALRVYGFDPDPEECARLNATARSEGDVTTTYVPVALGSARGTARLHSTLEPACSSLYPPITALVDRIPVLKSISPVGVVDVDLDTLDGWCEREKVGYVDALKLDTQGSELGVLQGTERVLPTVQVLEIEVEFNPIYQGQPLFGDVDAHLRARGFSLWRLDNFVHYASGNDVTAIETTMSSFYSSGIGHELRGGGGQLYWAHAYYARTELCPGSTGRPTAEQARRAAAVAECMGLPDLAATARAKASG
jgi:FkbM family methyltransferase